MINKIEMQVVNAVLDYFNTAYNNKEFNYCCGVHESSAVDIYNRLGHLTDNQLDNVIRQIAYTIISKNTIPNIVVFTTSSGENTPENVKFIRKYATSNVPLGINKYSNFKLTLHVWDFVKIYKKLRKV